jgi:quercetin dioxygenase-like cupin family protein
MSKPSRYRRCGTAAMLALLPRDKSHRMPFFIIRVLAFVALLGLHSMIGHASEPGASSSVQAENLLRESIAGVEGKEIIVSRVSFPPHTELPWHWHPGEEFFYVIEGSVTLKRQGESDVPTVEGDAQKIAPEIVHTGLTGELGAELVIFRVHASGEPERYLVD